MDVSLKTIKIRLQEILNQLHWEHTSVKGNGNLNAIMGLDAIRPAINELKSLNLFPEVIDKLQNSAIFTTSNDGIAVQVNEAVEINNNLSILNTLLNNFLEVLINTVPEESMESINIKLPPIADFDELSKVSREIHIALTQIILNREVNGQTKIVSVENGSIWFNVLVGEAAVVIIASLVWSSSVIYKKFQEGRLLEQQIRSLKVKNESLEDVLKAQKAETELMIKAEAEHISSEHFKENAPENIEKIKNSITILADLISKGAEIHPALVAPEQVSNLFPNPKNLFGIESKIKKIAS